MADAARASLLAESAEHLAHLHASGACGRKRAVTIRASRPPAGGAGALRPGEKLVHLQRHGQGFHNLLGDLYRQFGKKFDSTGENTKGSPYVLPELLDPPLTAVGRQQYHGAQPLARSLSPKLVIVSPLCRAVQTALLTFDHLLPRQPPSLLSTLLPSLFTPRTVPFIAVESARETFGRHTCDQRRSVSEIKAEFGGSVDFSLMDEETDTLWTPEEREPVSDEVERIYAFLLFLRSRAEDEIALVSHSSWLFTLLNGVVEVEDSEMGLWFATCEIRSVVLTWEDA